MIGAKTYQTHPPALTSASSLVKVQSGSSRILEAGLALFMLADLVSEALKDFAQVAALARATIPLDQVRFEILGTPHRAKPLPLGKMAVNSFFLNERALKVGKVGPNSGPRFTYQDYTGSAPSTLSGSILSNQGRVGALGLDSKTAADWIRANTDRIDILKGLYFD